jgi:hypothetical protein
MGLKILSGGETGAERAALDAAIKWGIPHGGWVRKGRKTDDGILPETYNLEEMPTTSTFQWTKQNVLYANGTVIFSHGKLVEEMASIEMMVKLNSRPLLHVDFTRMGVFEAAQLIYVWIREHKIKILNVAGTVAGKDSKIYHKTVDALETAFQMGMIQESLNPSRHKHTFPKTVKEAVEQLIEELPLKTRTHIARMDERQLGSLPLSLVQYMREKLNSWLDSDQLMESCRSFSGDDDMHQDDAHLVILRALWITLKKSYDIRVVKPRRG